MKLLTSLEAAERAAEEAARPKRFLPLPDQDEGTLNTVGFWSCVALENSSIQFADPSQHVEAPHHFDTLTTLKPSLGIALGDYIYTPNAGHPSGDPCNATG